MNSYVLKWRSYDGRSESVKGFYNSLLVAENEADRLNAPYQTNSYYVEPYSEEKAAEWGKTMNAQRTEVQDEGSFMPS
jgi:hypothetical protein